MKDSEPFWLTSAYVDHPCKFIISSFIIMILLCVLAFQLKYFEYSPITRRDYYIWTDERMIEWDKLEVAEEFLLTYSEGNEAKPLRMT